MKLLINASHIKQGGGLQVTISFIHECTKYSKNEYHVFISKEVRNEINPLEFPKNFYFYFLNGNGFSILLRNIFKSEFLDLENKINPHVVFSIFGPVYWKPKAPHLIGFALGQYLYNDLPTSKKLKSFSLIKQIIHKYFLYGPDHYVLETEDAAQRFAKKFQVPVEKISVVSNTYNSFFERYLYNGEDNSLPEKEVNEIRLLTVASFYPHKNLEVIKKVIPFLKNSGYKIKFFLTLPPEPFNKCFKGYEDLVYNLGQLKPSECPGIYRQCDFMFLPSLIECFSANYPEAMIMQKPILTSNLSFAKSICQKAAIYFNPVDPKDIATQIIKLAENKGLQSHLISEGLKRVKYFDSAEDRAKKYLEICHSICRSEKSSNNVAFASLNNQAK